MKNSPINSMLMLLVLFLLSLGCKTMSSQEDKLNHEFQSKKDLPIREIVEQNFPNGNVFIGAATQYEWLKNIRGEMIKEFSYVTPSNSFKQTRVHPEPGFWDWKEADGWLDFCQENEQVVRLHAPISPQCSKWIKEDDRNPEEMNLILEEYMMALCMRYNGHPTVKWLDVVNETIAPDGSWFGPKEGTKLWENPWPKLGYDEFHNLRPPIYIKKAFEIATNHAPNIKLIINQHGQFEAVAWDKMKALVNYLNENELRLDGVGWQAHITTGWEKKGDNLKRLSEWIDWAHQKGLEFHITENTVWTKSEDDWEAQADTYQALLTTLLSKRETGIVGYNLWQLVDQDTQRKQNGNIYDQQFQPKPSYYALREVLLNPPK